MRFFWGVYYAFAYHLLSSNFPLIGELCRKIRAFVYNNSKRGGRVDTRRHVYLNLNSIRIGYDVGFGENFHLQKCNLTLGNLVLMGPNVRIIRGGHKYERIDVCVSAQGG